MFEKRNIIVVFILIIAVIIGGYFFFDFRNSDSNNNNSDERFDRMATLKIVKNLDPKTETDFKSQFSIASKRFLEDPDNLANFFVINSMALIKQNVGDFQGAEELFLHAYELDPGGYIINGNIANLYHYGLKDYKKAERFYLDTLAIKGIQAGNHYTYFAETYELYFYRLDDSVKAESLLDRAFKELPENIKILSLAAEHYKRVDNKIRVRELYNEMLELDPNNSIAIQGFDSLN